MTKIYHNPRCRKSREALQLLQDKNIEPEIILYLKEPPTKGELKSLLKKLNLKPLEIIRKKEKEFAPYKGKSLTDDEWINILVENPKLIERPIVVQGNKAAIGRPKENILEIL
ncbi:MAG: arsenate reductase (glutaredoxin) [Saprospiraceae bacterium]|nr:arsenate reductase (glutaredoxin) [Saprospiraceae bacterium]